MKENLLIGNGINSNAKLNNESLSRENIRIRFLNNIELNQKEFLEFVDDEDFSNFLEEGIDNNIEVLAENCFKSFSKNLKENEKIKLQKLIEKLSIESIFFEKEFIKIEIKDYFIKQIIKYKNIFTLNYFEYWDKNYICNYLHGKINIENNKIISHNCIFNCRNDRDKQSKDALFPSNDLFPSDELKPNSIYNFYSDLENLKSLDIFGMSPEADENILEVISRIKEVRVYIHNMNKEKKDEWKKNIPHIKCIDSNNF